MDEFLNTLKAGEHQAGRLLADMLRQVDVKECQPVCWVLNHDIFNFLRKFDRYGSLFDFRTSRDGTLMKYPYRVVATARLSPTPFGASLSDEIMRRDPALLAIEYRNQFGLTGYVFHAVTDAKIKASLTDAAN
jgi:hypothetical protein